LIIEEFVLAFRKAALGYRELLPEDPGDPPHVGSWFFFTRR
jgi:hypothetical protein